MIEQLGYSDVLAYAVNKMYKNYGLTQYHISKNINISKKEGRMYIFNIFWHLEIFYGTS